MEVQVEESWEELRESFRNRRTRSAAWRKSQLRGLLRLLHDKETDIFNAMKDDLGKHPTETYRDEVGILVKSLNLTLTCLDKWMASSKVHVPLVAFPTSGEIVPEPLGVVLIFSSWNFPLGLALDPVIGAIAAGNAVLLKPSELAPACSLFLAKNIPLYLDRKAVKVVEGGATTAEQLLNKKWDKIFFTGSARVGRVIMSAAANHLTPVTLELGGKCPAILDLSSISSSRDRAIDSMKERIKKLYGDKPWENNSMSRIVNQNHFRRLRNLIEDPAVAASIVHGGSMDEENLFIEPTILLDPPLEAEIMTEEIFGPFLPVITVKRIQDSVDFISSRPQPLAIYVFSNDETLRRQVIAETSSGGVTFNDAIIQFACDTLPFGGVGQSGFGKYHGKFSFDAFSHGKSVLRRSLKTEMSFGYPPWTDHKLPFLRAAYNFDYIGIFLLLIGLKRK
ncbi:aldehyde dehydrogenase family 3 member F1-like isoform X2 [Magnolia sinica]|uniref:aldehyde dehydrogenase family 3 member F1-like isoform X2 n=1 Tax=Magnolia sinica TaxID=86752 RepID=UPI00265AA67E|nr:aldehyde dehydrogenase family 3 member F1-like isoform X2 [Magnolia sinica]